MHPRRTFYDGQNASSETLRCSPFISNLSFFIFVSDTFDVAEGSSVFSMKSEAFIQHLNSRENNNGGQFTQPINEGDLDHMSSASQSQHIALISTDSKWTVKDSGRAPSCGRIRAWICAVIDDFNIALGFISGSGRACCNLHQNSQGSIRKDAQTDDR